MFHRFFAATLVSVALVSAQESEGPRLTAREIFYGAKPAAPPAPAAVKTTPAPKAPGRKIPEISRPAQPPTEIPLQLAAQTTSEKAGLAMRWTITQLMPDGNKKEVPITKTFKSGDRINVRVEVNDFGYLYILARGSSGKWSPLFPSKEVANGDNRVGPNIPYTLPTGFVFRFDEQPGEERIFIVFSRKPEPDFDGLIYKVAPDRDSKPSTTRPAPGIILASNTMIGDPFVDRVRTMYARDLIVEKVEGEVKTSSNSVGPRFEHAAYVASKRGDEPRVTAEVSLVHK